MHFVRQVRLKIQWASIKSETYTINHVATLLYFRPNGSELSSSSQVYTEGHVLFPTDCAISKKDTAVKEMHFELCPTESGSSSSHLRNVHNDLAFSFVFASSTWRRARKRKKKESYRQSRIDEIARLCSTSCDNCESVRLPLQVLYSYWCSLSHPVTGTCWHCKLLQHPLLSDSCVQQCSTHCHPVCTEDSPRISLGTYYSDVCDLTTIHHSVKKKKTAGIPLLSEY